MLFLAVHQLEQLPHWITLTTLPQCWSPWTFLFWDIWTQVSISTFRPWTQRNPLLWTNKWKVYFTTIMWSRLFLRIAQKHLTKTISGSAYCRSIAWSLSRRHLCLFQISMMTTTWVSIWACTHDSNLSPSSLSMPWNLASWPKTTWRILTSKSKVNKASFIQLHAATTPSQPTLVFSLTSQ